MELTLRETHECNKIDDSKSHHVSSNHTVYHSDEWPSQSHCSEIKQDIRYVRLEVPEVRILVKFSFVEAPTQQRTLGKTKFQARRKSRGNLLLCEFGKVDRECRVECKRWTLRRRI